MKTLFCNCFFWVKKLISNFGRIWKHSWFKYAFSGICAVFLFVVMFASTGQNILLDSATSLHDSDVQTEELETSDVDTLSQATEAVELSQEQKPTEAKANAWNNKNAVTSKEVSDVTGLQFDAIDDAEPDKSPVYIKKNNFELSDEEWLKTEIEKENSSHKNDANNDIEASEESESFTQQNSNDIIATASVNGIPVEMLLTSEGQIRDLFKNYRQIDALNLFQDITLSSRIAVQSNTTFTINFNGHIIQRSIGDYTRNGEVFVIYENVKAVFNGGEKIPHEVKVYKNTDFGTETKTIYGGAIVGGKSTNGGGGIHSAEKNQDWTFNDITIAGCRAEQKAGTDGYGAGIYFSSSNSVMRFNNSTITGCAAYNWGGGMQVCGGGNVEIALNNSHIDWNYARDGGAGISCEAKQVYIHGDAVQDNFSSGSSISHNAGGCHWKILPNDPGIGIGIYNNGDNCVFSGLNINNNKSAYDSGGGILTASEGSQILNCNICDNVADQYGGGISNGMIEGDINLSITNCTILRNKANYGGGICVTGLHGVTLSGLMYVYDNVNKDNNASDVGLLWKKSTYSENWDRGLLDTAVVSRNSWVGVRDDAGYSQVTLSAGTYDENCFFSNNSGRKICWTSRNEGGTGTLLFKNGQEQKVKPDQRKPEGVEPSQTVTGEKYLGYDVQKGTIQYVPNGVSDTTDFATNYYYSDGYFAEQPDNYNTHLATLSILASCAAMASNAGNSGTETAREDGSNNYTNKFAHISQFFSDIGCSPDSISVNDCFTKKPTTESIGVIAGSKDIKIEGETKTLIPISIRGGGYEKEWASNCTINPLDQGVYTDGEHKGFSDAATQVVNFVNDYVSANDLTEKANSGKLVFWLTGYSRAGATANLSSKRLTDTYGKTNNKIFAYCTEPPKGGCESAIIAEQKSASYTYNGKYKNIHNVVNSADLVPYVAPTEMGFKRYGVLHYLPGTAIDGQEYTDGYNEVADNKPLEVQQQGSSDYYNQKVKMKQYLTGTNMYHVFDDYFHLAEINYVKGTIGLTNFICECGGWSNLQATQFNKDLLTHLQDWGQLGRTNFSQNVKISTRNYLSVQECLREVTQIIFGRSPDELAKIMYSCGFIKGRLGSLLDIWIKVIGKWDTKVSESDKPGWLDKFTNAILERSNKVPSIGNYLTDEEYQIAMQSLPSLINVGLNFLSVDYRKKGLYNTGSTHYQILLGTALNNVGNVIKNHYQEVTMAWAYSYDDYYKEIPKKSMVINKQSVKVPNVSYYNEATGQTEIYEPSQTEANPIKVGTNKVVKLIPQQEANNGSAFYYTTDGSDPKSSNTAKLYSKGITFDKVEQNTPVTIKVVAMQYGSYSDVCNIQIINLKTKYLADISTVDENGNPVKVSKELEICSTNALSTTQCYEGNNFVEWRVVNKLTQEDITEKCIKSSEKHLTITNFIMPDCDCLVEAIYKATEIRVVLHAYDTTITKAAIIGKSLVESMYATYYKDGVEVKNVPISELKPKWTTEGKEPEKNIAQPDTNYKMQLSFADALHDFGISFSNNTEVYFDNKDDSENIAAVVFDKTSKQLGVELNYSIGHNYYISTCYPGYIYVPNMYDKQQTIAEIKNQLPKQVDIITSMGTEKANVEWNDFTYEPQSTYTYFPLDSKTITVGEGVHFEPGRLSPDKATVDVVVGVADQSIPPLTTIADGTYRGTKDTPFITELAIDAKYKQKFDGLSFKYCAIYPIIEKDSVTEQEKTVWYKFNSADEKIKAFEGENPDPDNLLCSYDTYDNVDKIKLNAPEGTIRDFKLFCYTADGTSKEGKAYTESPKATHNYSITWMKDFKSVIKRNYVDGTQAEEDIEVKHVQNDPVSFYAEHADNEEFEHWEQSAEDPHQIINDGNKNNPIISVDKGLCNYHLTAVFKPVIQAVSLSIEPLESGEAYPEQIDNLDVTIRDKYTIHKDYAELTYINSYKDQNKTDEIVPFSSTSIAKIFVDFTDEDLQAFAVKLSDVVKMDVNEINTQDKLLGSNATPLINDYDYELVTEGEHKGALKNLTIYALMTTSRKPDLLNLYPHSSTIDVAYGTVAESFNLPKTANVSVEDNSITAADIKWDMEELKSKYDTSTLDEQEFTIHGVVQIPDTINNIDKQGKPLCDVNVECVCKVDGAPYTSPATANYESGEYSDTINVELSSETQGAEIWYAKTTVESVGNINDLDFVLYDGTPIPVEVQKDTVTEYAILTITKKDNHRSSLSGMYYSINGIVAVQDAVLDKKEIDIQVGQSTQISATVLPLNATDKTIAWNSSESDIARIEPNTDSSATITGLNIGKSIITVKTRDKQITKTCIVNVHEKPSTSPATANYKSGEYTESINVSLYTDTEGAQIWYKKSQIDTISSSNDESDYILYDNNPIPIEVTKDKTTKYVIDTITKKEGYYDSKSSYEYTMNGIVSVEEVRLDENVINIQVGQSAKLTATVLPENATDKTIAWKSSDTEIASVVDNKNFSASITGLSAGEAVITVLTNDKGLTKTCDVIVHEKPFVAPAIAKPDSGEFSDNIEVELSSESEGAEILYKLSKEEALSSTDEDADYVLYDKPIPIEVTEGTINKYVIDTITKKEGFNDSKSSFEYTMNGIVPVEEVTLNKDEINFKIGDTETLEAKVLPENATDKSLTWTSSNPEIARVEESSESSALITGNSFGSAVITVRTNDGGLTKTCVVNVDKMDPPPPATATPDGGRYYEDIDVVLSSETEGAKIFYKVTSYDVLDTSNDESGYVEYKGEPISLKVTKDKTTNYVIDTVTVKEGYKYSPLSIEYIMDGIVPVEEVRLNKEELNTLIGQSAQLEATVLPKDATDRTVSWMSTNPEVASIETSNGSTALVAGKSIGSTEVIVKTNDQGLTKSCIVNVGQKPKEDEETKNPEYIDPSGSDTGQTSDGTHLSLYCCLCLGIASLMIARKSFKKIHKGA